MTAETALIVATGTILGTILGASLGALLTYLLQRKMLNTARTHQLQDLTTTRNHQIQDRIAADTTRARDLALDAYVNAREGVGWLHSIRVEDSVLDPWKTTWADDLQANYERIRSARRDLDRTSAILGNTPLAHVARDTAHELLSLENAWTDAREDAEGMHNATDGTTTYKFYNKRWRTASDAIDTSRQRLNGFESRLYDEPQRGGHTDDSLLGRLRTEISNATKAAEAATASNPPPNA